MVQSSSKLRLSPAGSSVRFVKDSPKKMQNIYSQDSHATKQDLSSAALSSMTQSVANHSHHHNVGKPSPIISNLQDFFCRNHSWPSQCHGELPQMLGPKGDAQGGRHDAQQATVTWRRNDHRGTMGQAGQGSYGPMGGKTGFHRKLLRGINFVKE